METKRIAFCGLDCWGCPAFIATKNHDDELRRQTALQWSSDAFPVLPEEIQCAGCQDSTLRWKFCQSCQVRACATEQGVATCADCAKFPCEKLEGILRMVGDEARTRLESLRAETSSSRREEPSAAV